MRLPVCLLIAALLVPATAHAQDSTQSQDRSLDELLSVEIQRVFGASDRLQPVTEAPSSITIVTAQDIARYGYRTLADILRGVNGFYVSNDRNYSYLGARGLAKAGDYNTRILLLVNGHRVNDNVYDQARIGTELGIDPAMFDRVEIIRGPASSLYGTSAFFAVVNIVTKSGLAMDGPSLDLDAGSLGTQMVRAALGRHLSEGVDFAVSGTLERSDGMEQLYFPAFDTPSTNGGVAQSLDGEQLGNLYGRIRFHDVTVTSTFGRRLKFVPTASYETLFNNQTARQRTLDTHSMVDVQHERSVGQAQVAIRGSFDRYAYSGVYPYAGDAAVPVSVLDDAALGTRWGIDGRLTRPLPGRQMLTVGAEWLNNIRQNQSIAYHDGVEPDWAADHSSTQFAGYLQDEFKPLSWLLVNVGLRYDHHEDFRRATPRGALIVIPSPNQSFKYLYGRAFRAPNAYEKYYYQTPGRPRPESIDTHEIVWERYTGEWLRTSASTYWYRASQLITLYVPTVGDLGFVNDGTVTARGLELEAESKFKSGIQAVASYALQRATDEATGDTLTNSPAHMAKLRMSVPGPFTRSFASFELQHFGSRRTLAGNTIAPETVANVTLSGPLGRSLDLVGSASNLFDQRYADPGSDEHVQDSIDQNGRTFRVGIRWTPGAR